jgi:sensor domain CHASE-containing protein
MEQIQLLMLRCLQSRFVEKALSLAQEHMPIAQEPFPQHQHKRQARQQLLNETEKATVPRMAWPQADCLTCSRGHLLASLLAMVHFLSSLPALPMQIWQ